MRGGIVRLFPLWALVGAGAAYAFPEVAAQGRPAILPLLGLVMFGMGMTLTPGDFRLALRRPGVVAVGVLLQFAVMPAVAWGLTLALELPVGVAAGLILVGSAPGGTASNVVCYLARGDVALSVTLTAVSTVLALVATPWLTWAYAGRMVPVPVAEMLLTIAQIVLLPVAAGVALNTLVGHRLTAVKRAFPGLSVVAIVAIIGIVVGLERDVLGAVAGVTLAAVVLHNLVGLVAGYWLPWLAGYDERTCRTLAVEVGMQNSGLGVALASQYLPSPATLPGALFSIWHNLSGSVVAGHWAHRDPR